MTKNRINCLRSQGVPRATEVQSGRCWEPEGVRMDGRALDSLGRDRVLQTDCGGVWEEMRDGRVVMKEWVGTRCLS